MKRVFAVFAALLLLTSCGKTSVDEPESIYAPDESTEIQAETNSTAILVIDGEEIPFFGGKEKIAALLGDRFAERDPETLHHADSVDEGKLVLADEYEEVVDGILVTNYKLYNADKHAVTLLGNEGIGITREQLCKAFPDCVIDFMDGTDEIYFVNGEPYPYEHTDELPDSHPEHEKLCNMIKDGETERVVKLFLYHDEGEPCAEVVVVTLEKSQ